MYRPILTTARAHPALPYTHKGAILSETTLELADVCEHGPTLVFRTPEGTERISKQAAASLAAAGFRFHAALLSLIAEQHARA